MATETTGAATETTQAVNSPQQLSRSATIVDSPSASSELHLCVVRGFQNGQALLQLPRQGELIPATMSVCEIAPSHIGRVAVVAFLEGDPARPLVLGIVVNQETDQDADPAAAKHRSSPPLRLESNSEVCLRCGKASISLKSDGTVAIRGTNVASRDPYQPHPWRQCADQLIMWAIDNQTPFAVDRSFVRDRDGAEIWLVAVRGTFDIGPAGKCSLAEIQDDVALDAAVSGRTG